MNLLNVNTIFSNGFMSLVKEYIQDPIKADLKIHNYVIATIGQPPATPAAYFQNCGSAFWWPQTCENKARVQREVTAERDAYNAKYKAKRNELLVQLIAGLKNDPLKDSLKGEFERAERILQTEINKQAKKIKGLERFENIAWTIFSAGLLATTTASGNKVVIGAAVFSLSLLKDLSTALNVDFASLHRWSEEPPGLTDNKITSKGLQWDHARTMIFYLETAKELETLYKTVYPTAAQSVSNNAGTIGVVAAIAALLYWKL